MDLPDCPPGAEGYQDTVFEVPKKLVTATNEQTCTKAEQEFHDHLNSLKIKLEDGSTRCMVERRSRDISGKWIYKCYPCAAVCSGENILQIHISGKKHKNKLACRNTWPASIFDEVSFVHPSAKNSTITATEKVLQKMAEEVDFHNQNPSELDSRFGKFRNVRCHIQDTLDNVTVPLLGVEYLVEHPPEQPHHEPSYVCVLCNKQGHPRTISNHLTSFWHRSNYLVRHFPKAANSLEKYRLNQGYREGVRIIINRLAQCIESSYGRMKPLYIDKEDYEKEVDNIRQWIHRGPHISEKEGKTFEEVIDVGLLDSLTDDSKKQMIRNPSPTFKAAPTKQNFKTRTSDDLLDVSEEVVRSDSKTDKSKSFGHLKDKCDYKSRYEPYPDIHQDSSTFKSRYALRNVPKIEKCEEKVRPPNYEHKLKLAQKSQECLQAVLKKTLAYHEKHPEKHPLYPEEWKKFWNRRYKEIQSEGKDPSKHDFKPEWIVFWMNRIKELHNEELRAQVLEVYRKYCLSPPDMMRLDDKTSAGGLKMMEQKSAQNVNRQSPEKNRPASRKRSPERRRSPIAKHRSPDRRRSPDPRRRSPDLRRRLPDLRRRSPDPRRKSPEMRRRSPETRRRSPETRRRSPDKKRRSAEVRRRSPEPKQRFADLRLKLRRDLSHMSSEKRSPGRHRSPTRTLRSRSRSPIAPKLRSPARTNFTLESLKRSRSPLSQREMSLRNRSPVPASQPTPLSRQTVVISDDELKPDNGLSPWNSDNDIESVDSLPEVRSTAGSAKAPPMAPLELGPPENVVATLRLLVALEDYLGSLGPKIVDLLTKALKMEKDKPNSSEELLDEETAVVLIETAKEKLKGATQAGLVASAAAGAVRAAVVRAAATLHEADNRAKKRRQDTESKSQKTGAVPVAGIGEVNRAEIAQQMAEALVAQGKTDVSAEELAQLVDAVVGMAEAKKRGAAPAPTPEPRAGTASALQMLQSAYNENDKKSEKDDAPDAMDGLSDFDLETLLKNFNELSSEEQHSLIAYLKKLEVREPSRVERLREYVSAAALGGPASAPAPAAAPAPALAAAPAPAPASAPAPAAPLALGSDDEDDYTVEEVFQSATQKVKEDQMRQEMEIVKKSLEETKPVPWVEPMPQPAPALDFTKAFSSASDILAFLQTTIKSSSASNAAATRVADVVTTNTQLRSFGDPPEPTNSSQTFKPLLPNLSNPSTSSFQRANMQEFPQRDFNPQTHNLQHYDQQGINQQRFNQQTFNQQELNPQRQHEYNAQRPTQQSYIQGGPQNQQAYNNQQGPEKFQFDRQNENQQIYSQQNYDRPNPNQPHYNQQGHGPQNYNQNHNQQDYNQSHNQQDYNQSHIQQDYNQSHNQQDYNQSHIQQDYNQQGSAPWNKNENYPGDVAQHGFEQGSWDQHSMNNESMSGNMGSMVDNRMPMQNPRVPAPQQRLGQRYDNYNKAPRGGHKPVGNSFRGRGNRGQRGRGRGGFH